MFDHFATLSTRNARMSIKPSEGSYYSLESI